MTPRRTTARDKIRTVAEEWKKQYGPEARGGVWFDKGPKGDNREAVHKQLLALDVETATVEDVEEIIGNSTWTQLFCDQCGKFVPSIVTVGQAPDLESSTARLCFDCLEAAYTLFDCREHEDCREHPTTLGRACARASQSNSTPTEGT